MTWLKFTLIGFLAISVLDLTAGFSHAQSGPVPKFVPGELIVGYKSKRDRDDALQDLRGGSRMSLRGEPLEEMQIEEFGDTNLIFHVSLPPSQGFRQGDDGKGPKQELALLNELAKQLKDSDARVKFAHPNWIMSIDPPTPGPSTGSELQLQGLGVQPKAPSAGSAPNDPLYNAGMQWDFQPPPEGMNAVGAWKMGATGNKGIVVAVLDTGFVYDQEDVQKASNVIPGYNFLTIDNCIPAKFRPMIRLTRTADATDTGDACPSAGIKDPSWHGTHVAGLIGAAGTNNGIGIAGIARNVTVLPVRVLGRAGGNARDIADGLRWAAGLAVDGVPSNAHPADVINMSLGGWIPCTEEYVPELLAALEAVKAAGTVVVASAGNGAWTNADNEQCAPHPNDTACTFARRDVAETEPGGCPGVISVAASDPDGHLAFYSNFGNVTIMAPGGDVKKTKQFHIFGQDKELNMGVWSTVQGGYKGYNGTSQAAPHVAGAIALALAAHPEWRHRPDGPDFIKAMLQKTAAPFPLGACPADKGCGPGLLDAEALLKASWQAPSQARVRP